MIRIVPVEWNHITRCLRFEILGCGRLLLNLTAFSTDFTIKIYQKMQVFISGGRRILEYVDQKHRNVINTTLSDPNSRSLQARLG